MTLTGRRVVLGVSGGIASYKSCIVARRLAEAGAAVDVVLTANAAEFIRPLTFEALTGRPVTTSLWERDRALVHINLARDAELLIVAPATANLLARAAQGMADDVLTAIILARRGPVLAAPAMNDQMYAHPATMANLATLEERGWMMIGPATGALAEGSSDAPGRMVEPEEIVAHAERILRGSGSRVRDRRIVVTAGPTREALDGVRVISNRSSGRMGYALAQVAFARGADVLLISGPTTLPAPPGIAVERVESTEALEQAVASASKRADVLIMAAAPADYKPAKPWPGKRGRSNGMVSIALEPTADILQKTSRFRKDGMIAVGFALEVGDDVKSAKAKLHRKGLDLIVLNRADDPDSGTEVQTNRVTLITGRAVRRLDVLPKHEVAERVLDAIEELL